MIRGSDSLQLDRVVTQDEINQTSGRGSSIPTLGAVRSSFDRWLKAVGGAEGVKAMATNDQQHVLEELEPMWALLDELNED